MADNQKTVIFGGTGHYGRHIVKKLVQKGKQVRVLSRNIQNARSILGDSVEIIEGDVTSHESIVKSLDNVDSIIIALSAGNSKQIRRMKEIERDAVMNIINIGQEMSVPRLVYLSGYEIREELLRELNILQFGEIKLEIEEKIKQSNFNWTILGCAPSFELFFALARNGRLAVPGGGRKPVATIAAEDVGEITAQTISRNDLNKQRIKLTGSKALSFPEFANIVADVSGIKLKYSAIPLSLVNVVSYVIYPVFPFARYLYCSLKLLNNFPDDLAQSVPDEHNHLQNIFDYNSTRIETMIEQRFR